MLTFAIGSIQGNSAQLADLLEQCYDFAGRQVARYVFLGNFIKCGSDSRAVVDAIINLQEATANRVIALAGESENLLRNRRRGDNMDRGLVRGGNAALRPYAVASPNDLSANHRTWLQGLPDVFSDHHRLYVTDESQIAGGEHRLIVVGSRTTKGPVGPAPDGGILYLGLRSKRSEPPSAAAFASNPPAPLALFTARSV